MRSNCTRTPSRQSGSIFLYSPVRLRFSPAVATDVKEAGCNPKRVQREVQKQVQNTGIGTKSQQALKLQWEQLKTERKAVSRKQRETEKQQRFELKQRKKKEKHRGR